MPKPSGLSVKSIGLIAAGTLTLVFGIIVWVALSKAPPQRTNNAELFPADPSEIPNIEDTQTGGAMFITMVDKNDPTRIAGTLKADRFEPIGEGRRRLDQPESWVYLKDGRAVKITADFATMLMPDPNQPPESGTLEGNILIEAFDTTPAPGTPASPDTTPSMTARFVEPVEFERRYLRLRSAGDFQIESDRFAFSGADLTVILNELRDRIELIDVVRGDQIVIHTDNTTSTTPPRASTPPKPPASSNESTASASNPGASSIPTTSSPAESSDPIQSIIAEALTRYHIILNDSVKASLVGSGHAVGDRLDIWAALENNALPNDAIKRIAFASSSDPTLIESPTQSPTESSAESAPESTKQPTQSALHPSAQQPAQSPASSSDLIITWSGKMTVRPIDDDIPTQLLKNHLALTLGSNQDSGITFALPERNFTGQASALTYLATQARFSLESRQTQAAYINLESTDTGSLIATALNADLDTGIINLNGRGQITTAPTDPSDPDSGASIQWKNAARFDLLRINDQLSNRLTDAHFDGAVIAKQGGNSIGARTLDAQLNPDLPAANALKKLRMTNAVLSSASKDLLTGTTLDIDFIPGDSAHPIDPIRLVADGQVLGRNPESMLKTKHLVVTLMRDLAGDTVVRTADATGSVEFVGVDRTTANADSLKADGLNETMTLLGSPAKLAQGGSSIVGDHITINAKRRGIEVLGPGSFDHDITFENTNPTDNPNSNNQPTLATGHIRATWKGSMRFDDALGSIVCEDQVRVVSTPDAYTRDTLTAHRATIKLTPSPTSDPIAKSQGSNDRALLSARFFGVAPPGQDPIPAKVESRTYAQDDPERVIGLLYLEGSQIVADNQAQTLDVPAPGTLLILDRSEKKDQTQLEQGAVGSMGPGLTRFTWQGHMSLDRALGTARFVDQVAVRQKTLSTGKVASLSTDELDARFEIGVQAEDRQLAQTQSTRLLSASATGNVRFLFDDRELIADSAIYDAIEDSLFASALDNKLVTLYDESEPAPFSAKTMRWDLTKDSIEFNAPSPIRSPAQSPGG